MSSSEGRAASGSALSVQLVEDMVIDMGVMTPRNKRANPSEDSSSSGSGRLWIADGSDSSSDDDSVTVNAKLGQRKKKKKKIVAERKSDYFLKDKTPEGPGKGKVSDITVKPPMPVTSATVDMPSTVGSVSNQCRPNAQSAVNKPSTETTVDTGSVNAAVKAPAKRVPVGRSIENRLFIEFIGIALSSVDAFKVRTELNTKFGLLTADVPTPSSSYVRVHLGGPSRVANRATLLGPTDLCGYKIKVSEPREVVRHRGKYIQKVIKGVPPALSDSEILASVKDQERLPVLKVSRIHKVENKVKVPTLAVQINFTPGAVVPERLYIGFLTFKLYDYVPPPTRCFKCLSLGHISKCSRSDDECLTLDRVKHFLLFRRGTLVSDAAVVEDGANEGTVEHQEGVSRGPPMRARHGTHQVETLPAAIGHVLDVLGPREMTVENDSQELDAALVEQARGPQLQRQMGWRSSVASEFHSDGLGC